MSNPGTRQVVSGSALSVKLNVAHPNDSESENPLNLVRQDYNFGSRKVFGRRSTKAITPHQAAASL